MEGWSQTLTAWRPVLTQAGTWLSWASMALGLAVAARLFHGGLHRTYPVLTAYLLFDAVRSVPAMLVSRTWRGYLFLATEPVLWILYFLLVREIFLAVLGDHRGIRTVGLRAVRWAAIVAVAASALLLVWEERGAGGNLWLQSAFVMGRAATFAILLLLALITGFLNWFPVSASPNTRTLVIGYALLFLFKTVALFARNIAGNEFTVLASVVNLATMNVVLAWWALTLTAANQRRPDPPPRSPDGETERLLLQLDRINAALEKSTSAGSRR